MFCQIAGVTDNFEENPEKALKILKSDESGTDGDNPEVMRKIIKRRGKS